MRPQAQQTWSFCQCVGPRATSGLAPHEKPDVCEELRLLLMLDPSDPSDTAQLAASRPTPSKVQKGSSSQPDWEKEELGALAS